MNQLVPLLFEKIPKIFLRFCIKDDQSNAFATEIGGAPFAMLKNSSGFTLIEMLVVLVILSLLAGLILPRLLGRTEEAKRQTAELQIRIFENALSLYYSDNGFYPSTAQGLRALVEKPTGDPSPAKWRGPYLEKSILPTDPWDSDYIYLSPGTHLPEYDIVSHGKDKVQGGEGEFADIENWNIGRK